MWTSMTFSFPAAKTAQGALFGPLLKRDEPWVPQPHCQAASPSLPWWRRVCLCSWRVRMSNYIMKYIFQRLLTCRTGRKGLLSLEMKTDITAPWYDVYPSPRGSSFLPVWRSYHPHLKQLGVSIYRVNPGSYLLPALNQNFLALNQNFLA